MRMARKWGKYASEISDRSRRVRSADSVDAVGLKLDEEVFERCVVLGAHFDASFARFETRPTDLDEDELVVRAGGKDVVEDFGKSKRVDDVTLKTHGFCWHRFSRALLGICR